MTVTLVDKINFVLRLCADQNVTDAEFRVAVALALRFHNTRTARCDPRGDAIAAASAKPRQSVVKATSRLQALGYLRTNRSGGGRSLSNEYEFPWSETVASGDTFNLETVTDADSIDLEANAETVTPSVESVALREETVASRAKTVALRDTHIENTRRNTGKNTGRNPGRGSRLSEEWSPSENDLAYARNLGMPEPMITREVEKFKNYWLSASGKSAIKVDWNRAFRNWSIKSVEYAAADHKRHAGTRSAVDVLQDAKWRRP